MDTNGTFLGFFFGGVNEETGRVVSPVSVQNSGDSPNPLPAWLAGTSHYRLLPGTFNDKIQYHFDGLATVAQFNFTEGGDVKFTMKALETDAYEHFGRCIFMGSG